MPPRTCLARMLPRTPTSPVELEAMRRRAWLEQGIAVLPIQELSDDWTRQIVINEAVKLYGRRETRP
jgi:hypothetical protein